MFTMFSVAYRNNDKQFGKFSVVSGPFDKQCGLMFNMFSVVNRAIDQQY